MSSYRLAALSGFFALALAGQASAVDLPGAFHGNAYAAFANVKAGPVAATLARSAFQGCSCKGTGGQVLTNEIDNLAAGNVLTANVTKSTAYTKRLVKNAEVQNTAIVAGLNALGGLITADAIRSVATVTATATAITPSTSGTTFTNLKIAGQTIPVDVPANTVIPLAGIGSVTVNRVVQTGNFKNGGTLLVEALTIDVKTGNSLGLPIGVKIVLGHALAGFARKHGASDFGGGAYTATANAAIGDDLANKIGLPASVSLACQGTSGKTRTNSLTGANVAGILSMGDGVSTAFGGPEGGADVARTTSTVSSVNLLGGIIALNAIQAVAQSSNKDGVVTGSAGGSGFAGLNVLGITIPITLPPNSKLALPGIGNVVVNEQTVKSNGAVAVNGLHVTVTGLNLLGLPVGAEIVVAHAAASATPF
jgi:hypothetical protein